MCTCATLTRAKVGAHKSRVVSIFARTVAKKKRRPLTPLVQYKLILLCTSVIYGRYVGTFNIIHKCSIEVSRVIAL